MFKNFNFSSFLTTMAIYLLVMMGVNYFFFPQKKSDATEQVAAQKPLNRAVTFATSEEISAVEYVSLETDNCHYEFSNHGGVLAGLEFKKFQDKEKKLLKTVQPCSDFNRDQGMFLVALEKDTPFAYTLIEKVDNHSVTYQGENSDWVIKKKFSVQPGSYVIDLEVSFIPKKKSAEVISPRFFVASPHIPNVLNDVNNGFVVAKDVSSLTKTDKNSELEESWNQPELFGAEDKYFAHTLVGDHKGFFRKGFFSRLSNTALMGVLQGAECAKEETIVTSFYCGPKLLNELHGVDQRLEGLLSFGWLSLICKALLWLLMLIVSFVNNYGFAIVIVAMLTRLVFLPINARMRIKMAEYQRYQPSINAIRIKYRQDKVKQYEEIMRFHKEHNISPSTQLVGLLQLIAQVPFFIALSRLLNNYLALYHAPFLWIKDLSMPDPYYILPLIMVVATIVMQQTSGTVKDGRQSVMMILMACIVGALFTNFSAGLALAAVANALTAGAETYLLGLFAKKIR